MTRICSTLASILSAVASVMLLLGTLTACATAMAGTEIPASPMTNDCEYCDSECSKSFPSNGCRVPPGYMNNYCQPVETYLPCPCTCTEIYLENSCSCQ